MPRGHGRQPGARLGVPQTELPHCRSYQQPQLANDTTTTTTSRTDTTERSNEPPADGRLTPMQNPAVRAWKPCCRHDGERKLGKAEAARTGSGPTKRTNRGSVAEVTVGSHTEREKINGNVNEQSFEVEFWRETGCCCLRRETRGGIQMPTTLEQGAPEAARSIQEVGFARKEIMHGVKNLKRCRLSPDCVMGGGGLGVKKIGERPSFSAGPRGSVFWRSSTWKVSGRWATRMANARGEGRHWRGWCRGVSSDRRAWLKFRPAPATATPPLTTPKWFPKTCGTRPLHRLLFSFFRALRWRPSATRRLRPLP